MTLLIILALFALAPAAEGVPITETLVAVTDSRTPVNRGSLFLGGQFSNVVATSWTQATSFADVTIDASLVSTDARFLNGTAWLMTATGPGTTPASEVVAPVSFTAPFGFGLEFRAVPVTTLFSHLTLGPGTYSLVLSAPLQNGHALRWQLATDPVVTTGALVMFNNAVEADTGCCAVDPFPPASGFRSTDGLVPGPPGGGSSSALPLFDVMTTGPTAVPEPSTLILVVIGVGALGAVAWRREGRKR